MDNTGCYYIYVLQRRRLGMMKKALIDKIINDQQETMYQVYYIQSDGSHDFLPEIRFTKKMAKEHFETFDNIEDAINMILKYGYVLAEFNDCTGE
nr:MAG TPA: hypothetical protein [Caudoviricetes sp.]